MDQLLIDQLIALGQVIIIDLVLAGDNAIVIGIAVASLPQEMRTKAIFLGIAVATIARGLFAIVTTKLLAIVGLTLAGGILLLWVCWKFWRELEHQRVLRQKGSEKDEHVLPGAKQPKTMVQAMMQIVIADVTMALDNVLAVAGASKGHDWILIAGLVISMVLMAFAAKAIASLLSRYHWIAYVGLAIILYVAVKMIWEGTHQIVQATAWIL